MPNTAVLDGSDQAMADHIAYLVPDHEEAISIARAVIGWIIHHPDESGFVRKEFFDANLKAAFRMDKRLSDLREILEAL